MDLNLAILVIFCSATVSAEIPISNCDLLDENFDKCYKDFIDDPLFEVFTVEGIPELGIPALNKIHVTTTKLTTNSSFASGYVNVDLDFNGLEVADIVSFKTLNGPKLPYLKFWLRITHPSLFVSGTYDILMRIQDYNITGAGNYSMFIYDVNSLLEGNGILKREPDGTYLSIHKVTVSTDLKDAGNITVTGLEIDNPENAQLIEEILNAYPLDFFKEIYPVFQPKIEEIIQNVLIKYYDNTPISPPVES